MHTVVGDPNIRVGGGRRYPIPPVYPATFLSGLSRVLYFQRNMSWSLLCSFVCY